MPFPSLSCVIPAHNEADNLKVLIPLLAETLRGLTPHAEIIVVDDGSSDDTVATALGLANLYPVRCLVLSRNFGKEAALTAGLDEARGDAVVLMDSDLQHPVKMIPEFWAKWREGYDMVYALRTNRDDESLPKRLFTRCFYRLLRQGARFDIEPNAGDFRLLDRKVVESLKQLPERSRFMKGLYAWVGYRSVGLPFQAEARRFGKTRFNYLRLTRFAIEGIVSFTDFPLRISAVLGFAIALLAIGYGIYVFIDAVINPNPTPGWPTIVVALSFLSGIQLMAIGVLGEYIARVFNEVKGRPNYIVGKKVGHAGLGS